MMLKTRPTTRSPRRRTGGYHGFSLLEVLVSLGIFAVGLVAVAAVFPTAITIQRETVRELDGRRVAQNARTTLMALARSDDGNPAFHDVTVELSFTPDPVTPTGTLRNYAKPVIPDPAVRATTNNPNPVVPMIDLPWHPDPAQEFPPANLALDAPASGSFHGLLNLETRSYPQNLHAVNAAGVNVSAFRRNYYWYPLIQAKGVTTTDWFAYLIVMHRSGSQAPPEVRRSFNLTSTTGNVIEFGNGLFNDGARDRNNDTDLDGLPDYIQPGDKILADDGKVHRVVLAEANRITVESPNVGNPGSIYFAVAKDGVTGDIITETRSPMVWIEESIKLSIHP